MSRNHREEYRRLEDDSVRVEPDQRWTYYDSSVENRLDDTVLLKIDTNISKHVILKQANIIYTH